MKVSKLAIALSSVALISNAGVRTVVEAVPEPATWLMLLLGFGALGTVIRTKRRQPALAA